MFQVFAQKYLVNNNYSQKKTERAVFHSSIH